MFLSILITIILLSLPIGIQCYWGGRFYKTQNIKSLALLSILTLILSVFTSVVAFFWSIKGQLNAGLTSLSPGVLVFGFYSIGILVTIVLIQFATLSVKMRS